MANESSETVIIEPVRAGSIPQNELVYPANVVNALVEAAVKRESASRDASIRAALDKYTTSILDTKLNTLEMRLTDSTGELKRGINWKGSRTSLSELNEIPNPKHGDLYIINGVGYIYTVEAIQNPDTGQVEYDTYWAAFNNAVDLSNYVTKDATWSTEKLEDLQKLANRSSEMILKLVTQLAVLIDKTSLGSSATNAQLAWLQGVILKSLQNGHYEATKVLDEELNEDTDNVG